MERGPPSTGSFVSDPREGKGGNGIEGREKEGKVGMEREGIRWPLDAILVTSLVTGDREI